MTDEPPVLCYYDREGYRTAECIAGTCACKRGPSSSPAASSAEIAGTGDTRGARRKWRGSDTAESGGATSRTELEIC